MSDPIQYEFELPLTTEDELRLFVEKCFGVYIPNVTVCENHSTPWRAFADAYFARKPMAVWKASRALGGKTFLLSMLGLVEALTLKINVNLLGGSGEQSARVLEHMNTFWHYANAPKELLASDISRETRFAWGNRVEALMASQTSVRGPHPVRLLCDEIDEMDLMILDAALGQPMTAKGVDTHVVMSCFSPETPVTMFDGTLKPISEIMIGDQVLGVDGKAHRVTRIWQRPHSGEILRLKPRGLPSFRVTREHMLVSGKGELPAAEAAHAWLLSSGGTLRKTSVSTEFYNGTVYDLTVEPGHRYVAGGILCHNSTHQYADGTMTEVLKRAGEKPESFGIHEWCFKENLMPHGWLDPEQVARKRAQMTEATWRNEVELQEPSPETRAISPAAVARMFQRDLGAYEGSIRQDIRAEPPIASASYCHGADWAKKQDRTVIITYRTDVRPLRLVAFVALQREEWPIMAGELAQRIGDYPGPAFHDGTGLGDVVNDILHLAQVSAMPFMMIGRQRANLLSNYIRAVEAGDIVAPYIRYMENEHRLASVADVYQSGATLHLPDTIAAAALAWNAARMITNVDTWLRDLADIDSPLNRALAGRPQILTPEQITANEADDLLRRGVTQDQLARLLGIPQMGSGLPRRERDRRQGRF